MTMSLGLHAERERIYNNEETTTVLRKVVGRGANNVQEKRRKVSGMEPNNQRIYDQTKKIDTMENMLGPTTVNRRARFSCVIIVVEPFVP